MLSRRFIAPTNLKRHPATNWKTGPQTTREASFTALAFGMP
jgi:hypothetical protein